ncbi:MAG: polysaccharide deacetylase family protein [Pseudomonadota bacterium]
MKLVAWVVGLSVLLTGCVSQPVRPVAPAPEVLAENQYALVVRALAGDTYASLAEAFLGSPMLDWVVREENANRPLSADVVVVIPKGESNPIGVSRDHYQVVPVLSYHHFSAKGGPLTVHPESFRRQLQYLKTEGFRAVSLADFKAFLAGQKRLPPRSVLLTIDDGYPSVYDIAFPLLREFAMPAVVFVYSDFVERGGLTFEQLREMERSGLVDVQSHSKSHHDLTEIRPDETPIDYEVRLAREVAVPKRRLERDLAKTITTMAYPYGATNRPLARAMKRLGMQLGFTVRRGANAFFDYRFALRRSMVYRKTDLSDFAQMLRVRAPH